MIFGKTVNKYYLKYAHLFLLGLIALVFVDYYQLEIPALTGSLIDELVNGTMDKSGLLDFVEVTGKGGHRSFYTAKYDENGTKDYLKKIIPDK